MKLTTRLKAVLDCSLSNSNHFPSAKNANAKVVRLISRRQKWSSCWQFFKNCIFPNIQLKGVVNRLTPFKNLSDHLNRFLMG